MVPTDQASNYSCSSSRRGVLVWIAIYKLVKSAIALVAGFLALHLLHRDLTELVLQWIHRLSLEPDGRVSAWLLARALNLDEKRLRLISIAFFVYATLYLVEGIGLYLQKLWAEWLTIIVTALLLPLEVYELYHRPSAMKVALILVNLAVIAYLVWRLKCELAERRSAAAA
jgi:uncharacterized membrane protein (DUF2068 family)